MVFACSRDVNTGDWDVVHSSASKPEALKDALSEGSIMGVPRSAASAIVQRITSEVSGARIKTAALEAGSRLAEGLIDQVSNFISGRGR